LRLFRSATLLVILLGAARVLDPYPAGLTATHFADTNWSSAPVRSQIDSTPSTARLFAAWRGAPPERFSVTWRGSIVALAAGDYTFATTSDDGSWVYVDNQLVVDNGGPHEVRAAAGTIHLDRGVHAIFIKYFEAGGPLDFQLRWARNGAGPQPVPAWALTARSVEFTPFVASIVFRRAFVGSIWLWFVVGAFILALAIWRDARSSQPTIERALLVAGGIVLVFVLPHDISGDGRVRYLALAQLIEWHELSAVPYSMVGPLLSTPLYLLGTVVLTPEWWCARFNALLFLAGLWITDRLMRTRVEERLRVTFLLLLLACSMFPVHLEGFYAEAFSAMAVGVGLLAVDGGFAAAGWTSAVAGVVNTPAAIVGLLFAAVKQTWDTRRIRHLTPVAVATAAILLESWIRRGSPLVSGYEGNHGEATALTYSGRRGFSYPLAFGVLSILLSFGKGLLFYAPGLVLPLRRSIRTYGLWLAFLAGLVLIYAKWWAWFGGLFWGPRFFVFASLPASLAIAWWLTGHRQLTAAKRAVLLAVVTVSAWVAIDGVVFGYSGLGACRDPNLEWLCFYVPEYSALWRPFVEPTTPAMPRVAVGLYVAIVYSWLVAPLVSAVVADLRRAFRRAIARTVNGEPWRI
jgi:hypothetical protein